MAVTPKELLQIQIKNESSRDAIDFIDILEEVIDFDLKSTKPDHQGNWTVVIGLTTDSIRKIGRDEYQQELRSRYKRSSANPDGWSDIKLEPETDGIRITFRQ